MKPKNKVDKSFSDVIVKIKWCYRHQVVQYFLSFIFFLIRWSDKYSHKSRHCGKLYSQTPESQHHCVPERDYFLNRQARSGSLLKCLFKGSIQNTYARRESYQWFKFLSVSFRRWVEEKPHCYTGVCGSLGRMFLPNEQMLRDFKIHSIHIHIRPSEMSASMALFHINLHWQDLIEASGWVLQCFQRRLKKERKGKLKSTKKMFVFVVSDR